MKKIITLLLFITRIKQPWQNYGHTHTSDISEITSTAKEIPVAVMVGTALTLTDVF